ncbi:N-acetylmuramoyl-L-alanine amidase [Paenibacillus allorhizosphaerae]|uniref:SLH domain-containing protein n=1 Tax=Paenibacillus allorhizosphaerae TaxID=2849866 RepID=A0ABN7TTN8_9BACL|nr:N-acetylmuramoyl-L-alanine amidase [Paenibacillus allorhizosphaerae]CAG7655350.1 hypothetical protein PAECIP111802_06087 [Paenibacillus allorhizosphaerae]
MRKRWMQTALMALSLLIMPGPASAAKIVVDAGHGGSDPGAIGVNGLQEKQVNLDIAKRLRDLLVKEGYEVALSRDSDLYLSLQQRVDFMNEQKADLFVSIHANSYSSPSARGAMVLYYDDRYPQASYPASEEMKALTPQSKELAQKVLDNLVDATGVENLGLVPSAVYVVRNGTIPSILVETAFLSSPADAALLADSTMRQKMARGIADGIETYLPPNVIFPDTLGHWARESILRLKTKEIIDGIGNRYEPNRMLTRAEWMTLLDRVFDLSAAKPATGGACPAGDGTAGKGLTAATSVSGAVYGGSSAEGGDGCEPVPAGGGASGSAAGNAAAGGADAFKDMNAKHWAFTALDKAVKAGVLEGYPDGTLRPDRPVTRAEVAAMFQRLAGTPSLPAARQPFKDVAPDYWALGAIAALKQAGWIDGVTSEQFAPDRSMTRAEAAALLDRYVAGKKSNDKK